MKFNKFERLVIMAGQILIAVCGFVALVFVTIFNAIWKFK